MKKEKIIRAVTSEMKALKEAGLGIEEVAIGKSKAEIARVEQRTYEQLYRLIVSIIGRNGFKLENSQSEEDVVHDIMLSFLKNEDAEDIDLDSALPPLADKKPPIIDLKMGYPESLRKLIWQKTYHYCIDIFRYEQRRKYATPEEIDPINWLQYWEDWERWATWEPGVELTAEESDKRRIIPKRLPRFSVSAVEQPTIEELSLETTLNMLPEKERAVVQLIGEGYQHNEIAEKLKITGVASRKRLERARTRLQSLYPHEFMVEWK